MEPKANQDKTPLYSSHVKLPELTLRAIVLSLILAAVLAASNAYLALKLGQTVSASIPASVLALGILRFFRNSNVLESNLAQTAASAGEGVAAAVSFVLPAMIIVHAWNGFPYWQTFFITIAGGLLGVLFSIPLRRILLNLPELKFPEGTAIGNVLKASASGGSQLKYLLQGGLVGGLVSLFQSGFQVLSDSIEIWQYAGQTLFGTVIGFSPALFAAGYIVGIEVGLSILVGIILGWSVILPLLALHYGIPHDSSAYDASMDLWSAHLRFVGVGAMLVGGVSTLFQLIRPIVEGMKHSLSMLKLHAASEEGVPRTEKDLAFRWVILGIVIIALALFGMLGNYMLSLHIFNHAWHSWIVAFISTLYVVILGILLATIGSYFTGLLGSSNNPLSGLLIISVLLLSLIYLIVFHAKLSTEAEQIISIIILIGTVIAGIASIANENIQDLKAGQMVGATPWKQQLMLAVGVFISALVIGPVLNLLYQAYGMGGVFPHSGMDPSQTLAAPQSSLLAAVAQGVITHQLQWALIGIGAGLGLITLFVDRLLTTYGYRMPVLAVGAGIYLPPEILTAVVIGSIVNYLVKKKLRSSVKGDYHGHTAYQGGILLACGLVAGSSLMGVFLAVPFVIAGNSNVWALVSHDFAPYGAMLGSVVFIGMCYWLYRVAIGKQQKK